MGDVCSACGRPILSLDEFERELGEPLFYIIQKYDEWKRMNKERADMNESKTISE